ncbi:hypothetical protein HMPREF1624_00046 [Sporothrix schenckii ATCC 58251]|uniref:High-temperature-induced dauer-formation protein n=1 Tax=Sporothrix schenckii (strain ATCC 58251 / de Perez 2211183) TaxID=1391915 RepID=U7Q3H6_SPOS1|nr:hypothetical protein HMPREF1624_00046 [Sporothrix schenckii ATCC 58251]
MGASDSKLVFKKGIFRLSEERNIRADDPYWTSFWELPESPEDVFSLFSPADIRRTRDSALENLETLLLAVTSRLFSLRHHPSFPEQDIAPERDLLNCVRVLTRVLPYIYERESLQAWEERFFWSVRRKRSRSAASAGEVLFDEADTADQNGDDGSDRAAPQDGFEEAKPLAEELIDTLIDLLFFSGFTVARQPPGKPRVSYTIWQSGVGCNTTVPTTKESESNRCELLRLLLTLSSSSLYRPAGALPAHGVRSLTYICTCPDKQVVLSVLCSLLNTTVKYNPASWRVPYNNLVFKDPKQILVTYSLHFLLVVLLYPIPPDPVTGSISKNYYRHFLGRLHRPTDFQFIVDGMTRILNQPLQATTSYIPGTQSSVKFAPEIVMLFWEITQCNKRFRSFIIDTQRAHDFVILILFYALECKNDSTRQGVVRMCAFLLQTMSVEKNFGINLNKMFDTQDTLPPAIRIQNFRGTYADFLIQSIYSLITASQSRLTAIYPALLAVINNIAAYVEGLSARTSSRLIQLFSSMSSPSFLLANDSNHNLLCSLLEALNATIEHQYSKNPQLVYTIVRNRKRFESLRNLTLDNGREEIERRMQRRKDSGATGDEPAELGSRRSSVDSLRSPTTSHHHGQQHARPSQALSDVAEDDAFAIGGDDDEDESDDDEPRPTPSQSSPCENPSRASPAMSVEDAVPTQVRGMSEKARGKMPAGAGPFSFSRQNSTTSLGSGSAHGGSSDNNLAGSGRLDGLGGGGSGTGGLGGSGHGFEPTVQWFESWLPELPLHTILAVMQQISALIPRDELAVDYPSPDTLQRIQDVHLAGIEPSTIRVHSFEWSALALGWYESMLWSFIFSSEMQVAKGTVVGVWNSTAIKLFRVQEAAAQGPSLTSPRGAVDAVGSNIVSRIGQINLRGNNAAGVALGSAAGGGAAGGSANHDAGNATRNPPATNNPAPPSS